jgi:hypothetical protein
VNDERLKGWLVFLATVAFGFSLIIASEISERLHRRRRGWR